MNRFEPGLLDKLFGDGTHQPAPAVVRQLSLDELKGTVARQIESLLNARITFTDERLAGLTECQRSILTYGLNDFAGLSLASHDDRMAICNSIQRAIERHEPRLKQVTVKLELTAQSTNVLCFAIQALLVVHPAEEPVNFDAMLQPCTLQYSVTRARAKRL
ncbi:type VI secretion system baseplate subunit TssE [Trinickia dinghuensis]|uniref:Type VI secretion system baseplate subunit TssE n=1 Tax=Trinickia dinghuensis TaxID=2291023 RepID=A0A3D8JN33_9BURK|nr:type VI secretion system baseplate subunit TssE [Trinickia dinghuensis]RDU94543.1 type VI secretion system baseplate subunit TssE [Trinickia dinghuensis]